MADARARPRARPLDLHGDPLAAGAASTARRAAGCRSTRWPRSTSRPASTPRIRAGRRACAASLGLPGDKSISHRALMLAAARRRREPDRAAPATARTSARRPGSCRALGARRASSAPASDGRRRSTTGSSRRASTACIEPDGVLDCGNSGTSLRLFAGILAGLPLIRPSSTATPHCGAARWLVSSSRCARWARARTPAATIPVPPLTVVGRSPLRAVDAGRRRCRAPR